MISTLPQTLTLVMPAFDGVTLHHKGLNYLRPELLLDFVTISEQPMLFVTPVAVLYSTVGVVRYVNLRRIPVAVSGRVIYPICTQALPDLRAKLIINTQARKLKFLESLVAMREQPAASSTKVIGLALEFTVQQPS